MNEIIEKLKERLAEKEAWLKEDDPSMREDWVDGYRHAVGEEIEFLQECISVLEDKENF